MISSHQQVARDAATIDDVDAITQAVQLYIDGCAEGDRAKLAEAFHPEAQMYGAIGEQRFDLPMTPAGSDDT